MRILHVAHSFFPYFGGSTVRLYNLLTRLPAEVCLYVRALDGEELPAVENYPPNLEVKRVPLNPPPGIIGRVPYLGSLYNLNRRVEMILDRALEENFDIAHAHAALEFGLAPKKMAQIKNKPFINEVHAVNIDMRLMSDFPRTLISYPYFKKTNREICHSSDRVITLTESLKEWINRFYKVPMEKITVVPNGVDMNIFTPGEGHSVKANELREILGISGSTVLYAGFMDDINGISALAQVIPLIIKYRPGICFVLIGSGPEERRLKSLAQEYPRNVKFLPKVAYSEMPAYYQMCDLFIVPRPSTISAETVTPLKLLEAMAMEKPVLGSNVGGITEAITHGENGYLFQKGNKESFQRTLLEALDDDNTGIGRKARKTVVERYDWDRSARILQQVYEEVLWK